MNWFYLGRTVVMLPLAVVLFCKDARGEYSCTCTCINDSTSCSITCKTAAGLCECEGGNQTRAGCRCREGPADSIACSIKCTDASTCSQNSPLGMRYVDVRGPMEKTPTVTPPHLISLHSTGMASLSSWL